MQAVSPQMMMWDPSMVSVPTQATDLQAPVMISPYRYCGTMPQIITGPTIQSPLEPQGVVWIQQPHIISPDVARDNIDSAAQNVAPGLVSGHLPVTSQQQNMLPVIMSINGQRVFTQQPLTQHHGQQGIFYQVSPESPVMQHQLENMHLVNLAGINQRLQQGVRLTSFPPQVPVQDKQHRDRAILTPKRRNGNVITNIDTVSSWRRVSDERMLGGLNTAIRRRSQSADRESKDGDSLNTNSGSPTPNKRAAPTFYPNTFEVQSEFWRAPDSRTMRKLVDIIEYYFSDECLTKNGYMLKQLSSGESDGYISLRRVAALKRVKSQTRDLRTVAYAVRLSSKLEINEDSTMIRRMRPLPENIEAPRFIRSVLAINLPKGMPSVEDVTSLFTPYGDLTQVRVLRPGKTIPSYLKDYTAWVPDLGTRVCAVVEFENQEEAQKACREINMQNRGQNSLRVALLKPGARIRRTLYRKYKDESNDDKPESKNQNDVTVNQTENKISSCERVRRMSESSEGSIHGENNNRNNNKTAPRYHYDASGSGSDTGSDTDSIGSKTGTYRITAKQDIRKKNHLSGDSGYSHSSSSDERESIIASSLPTRRVEKVTKSENLPARRYSPIQKKFVDGVPVGVERQPRGPTTDNSKGFNESRKV